MKDFENENELINEKTEESQEEQEITKADINAEYNEPESAEYDEENGQDDSDDELSGTQKFFKELLSWVMCLVIAFVAAFAIRTWIFTVVKVDGQSMEPTLHHNERLFTRIIGYQPERGDVIIFNPKSHPDIAYVKRIIALEGDRIWVDESNGEVHLKKNGSSTWEVLSEDYTLEPAVAAGIAQKFADSTGEEGLLIQKDHVFVMGDNRNNSNDSRNDFGSNAVGQVSVDSIIGEAVFRWWPLSEIGTLN